MAIPSVISQNHLTDLEERSLSLLNLQEAAARLSPQEVEENEYQVHNCTVPQVATSVSRDRRWTKDEINEWYGQLPWLCGFNYLPRTAVNWQEMWQADTFRVDIMDEEFQWAAKYGYNSLRTNLPYIVWKNDPDGLKMRIREFLTIAARHGIYVMFCLLDDCGFAHEEPFLGPQKEPTPNLHNSQATASPGRKMVLDEGTWPLIKEYVQDIVRTFKNDSRVFIWDLYNEPGNDFIFKVEGERFIEETKELKRMSCKLMVQVFEWVREVAPIQPLTVAGWHMPHPLHTDPSLPLLEHAIDETAFELSDVISYHAYCNIPRMLKIVSRLEQLGRPMFVTEWLARQALSTMQEQLPLFKAERIASYHWGMVQGRTQTHIPWPNLHIAMKENGTYKPDEWFHDTLRPNGEPYDPEEMELVQNLTRKRLLGRLQQA